MSDDEHARAHAATISEYIKRGERPAWQQIVSFGAAGQSQLKNTGRFQWLSSKAPILSSAVVILSGIAAPVFAH